MQISLVRISLLQFFKTFHKYALREFWAIYFIIVIFWAKYLAKAFFGYSFHYYDLPHANFGLFISLMRIFG
jgi:hypothetical protein